MLKTFDMNIVYRKIRGLYRLLLHPMQLFGFIVEFYCQWLPDKLYLKIIFRKYMGYQLNLDNPKTFSEKIQWLKLYDRNPNYTKMVDKYAVKDYVASKIGKQYIIPTLAVYDKPEDIEWDKLPNQFVLKTTHSGGSLGVVICKEKITFDKAKAVKLLNIAMRDDIYKHYREWPYKDVPKRIIVEQYMEEKGHPGDLADYKFFCFNGEPKFCQVIRDRNIKETIDFYDMDWVLQEFVGLNPVARNGLPPVARPVHLERMKEVCRKLSQNIPFVRIDLYVIKDKEYFGEVTFFPASGMGVFTPEIYNEILGKMISLPGENLGGVIIDLRNDIRISKFHSELRDYKFFCFNGKVEFFKVDFDRFIEHHANYYTTDCKLLEFGETDFLPCPDKKIELPSNLQNMIDLAETLSKGIPFLRVDFYNINGRIYFGELTFFPASGLGEFTPRRWNLKLGELIHLNTAMS